MEQISLIAGMLSTSLFISSAIPMVLKAYRTRDMQSYSKLNILLANLGNLIYWLYVISLPPGPIWLLHAFYTITSGLMLFLLWQSRSRRRTFNPYL
jgi:hypothetical protein